MSEHDPLRRVLDADKRYAPEAYRFVFESLEATLKQLDRRGHVTGRELLEGIRLHALDRFGGLAPMVFAEWGVRRTEDFGEIVFNLVEAGLMGRTEQDTRNDFKNGYDFEEAFAVRSSAKTRSQRPT